MKTARRLQTLATLSLALLLSGCVVVVSLSPLYTDRDLVFDPHLLGTWGEAGATETWTFQQRDERSYRLLVGDGYGSTELAAHLLELGGRRFLDIYPEPSALAAAAEDYEPWLVPAHIFVEVAGFESSLEFAILEPAWLEAHLRRHPRAIEHRRVRVQTSGQFRDEERIVLTASTRDLQKFILKNVDRGAFGEPGVLVRRGSEK